MLVTSQKWKVADAFSCIPALKHSPKWVRQPGDSPNSAPVFSLKMKRRLELHKDSPWEHGDPRWATHAVLPSLLLQPQQGWKGPGDVLGMGGMLQVHERESHPPVTRLALSGAARAKWLVSKVTQTCCFIGDSTYDPNKVKKGKSEDFILWDCSVWICVLLLVYNPAWKLVSTLSFLTSWAKHPDTWSALHFVLIWERECT